MRQTRRDHISGLVTSVLGVDHAVCLQQPLQQQDELRAGGTNHTERLRTMMVVAMKVRPTASGETVLRRELGVVLPLGSVVVGVMDL